MRKLYTIILLLTCIITVQAQKRFYNLTAEELRIDSFLPNVAYSVPLPQNYQDSTYTLSIRYPEYIDMPATDIRKYKAICKDINAEKNPKIQHSISIDKKRATFVAHISPIVFRNGKYQYLVSFLADLKSSPVSKAKAKRLASPKAERYAEHSVLSQGKWAKIRVSSSGIHQLTASTIKSAGFSDLSKVRIYGYGGYLVPEVLTDEYLREYDDLKEIPTCTVGEKKLFYAKGSVYWDSKDSRARVRNPYSDYGYYFITQDDNEPLTCTEEELLNTAWPTPDAYHTLYEEDQSTWMYGGRNLFYNEKIESGNTSKNYIINIPEGNTQADLTISVTANARTEIRIYLNGKELGSRRISLETNDVANGFTDTWNVDNLHGNDTVIIKNVSGGTARLDYISLRYDSPKPAPVLATDNFPTAEYVHRITNQDLHADKDYDMVIIIPTSQKLLKQAQILAKHHADHDGLNVRIVPADELYNEFSSGTPDVSAYKRYMKMLYDRSDSLHAPKSLLLFGDCTFDNRMLTSELKSESPDDYLLCYESENSFSSVDCYVSDDFLTYLDDEEDISTFAGLPDIGVGRFPCITETEAAVLVDKTINYTLNANAGPWQNTIMFLGDDGNNNIHMNDVNDVAEQTIDNHPGYYVRKVYWDAFKRTASSTGNRYPDATSIIKQQQNNGALIIDYAGHGSPTSISHEIVLSIKDFASFKGPNLPLWVTASCEIMPFDSNEETIGEKALLNPEGGAVAFYGTTRTVYAPQNKKINSAFMEYVLTYDKNGKPITLGEAQRQAKNYLVKNGIETTKNKLQYSLLGDPALSLALPTYTAVIDNINGIAVEGDSLPQLRAGDKVSIKGHIELAGSKAENFSGTLDAMVRDTKETIRCKLNNTTSEGADTAFVFTDRKNTLYHGTNKVENGEFTFTFAVPKDINYADGTGLINIYAYDATLKASAHGACNRFTVNGSNIAENDSIGPSIYCYLNSEDFTFGGEVNSTPFFVAQISDKDGINASGAGIGHDMMLIIDGDSEKSYNLNDNFTFDYESYTSGQTYYALPALSEGKHTLKFRAWDILNNSSTTTLDFVVKKNIQPNIVDVYATNNPARESTTFVVAHNFCGAELNLEIDIMDTSGRLLWSASERGTATTNTIAYKWNLTTDSGARLNTGIYLYRIKLSSNGSSYASKTQKILVINN
ncbi:MAG: type IX secretion system sortase PorU [Prevotella sp.]|nr:type IX secretion system sortase PorU [Prevotella sp.]